MIKRLVLLALISINLVPTSAFSQDQCSDTTALTVAAALEAAVAGACDLSGRKLKKRINNYIKRIRDKGVKRNLGAAFVNAVVKELNELKNSSCSDTTSEDACTDDLAVTPAEATTNMTEKSCSQKTRNKRQRNLKSSKKAMKKTIFNSTFVATNSANIDTLLDSADCGKGGEVSASKCQKNRSNTDGGLGGWLHKPKADHNPSFVNLLPSSDRASFCVYETKQGKKLYSAQYTGIANGNRQHFRPSGLPSCTKAPSNMVFRCNISGTNVCYTVPNACQRYD